MMKKILIFLLMTLLSGNSIALHSCDLKDLGVDEENIASLEEITVSIDNESSQEVPQEVPEETIEEVQLVVEDIETIKYEELQSKLNIIKQIEDKKEWFLAYKDLVFEYTKWVDPPETVFDVFTEEEVNLICRVVETETYQRSFDCKVNVASVIFNRFEDGRFGDTITEIITAPKQFAYFREIIDEETILAVMYAYEIEDTAQGALFFHSFKEAMPTFSGADYIFSDQAVHHFYK